MSETLRPPSTEGSPESREVLYRGLFEHALIEVHIWKLVRDHEGRILTWQLVDANSRALRSWGRTLSDIVGLTTDEIFPGADATKTFIGIVNDIFDSGRPKEWEAAFPATGQILQMVSYPVGEFFVSTGFDITELRTSERELAEALSRLKQVTVAGKVGLWDWDLVTDEVHYSDEYKLQLGYEPHEFGDTYSDWECRVHPDDLASTIATVESSIASHDPEYETVFRMRHRDGSWRWILAQASVLVKNGRATRMLGSHVDITERRRLEEKVVEAQRLESVATLAAGIAHDFNNLLTAISGNLSVLMEEEHLDPEAQEILEDVATAASGATGLTDQLLTFSMGGAPLRDVVELAPLLRDSAQFVARGSRSRCVFDLADDLGNVHVDSGQFKQVIGNLVLNGIQAMPDGGIITIRARNRELTPDNTLGLGAGCYIEITVQDQGVGIEDAVMSRIFDPFFTTKKSGSGLGLATSYSIVSRHGGRMSVASALGDGTTFHVWLPLTDASVANDESSPSAGGSGRILVMDDERPVRNAFRRMLEHLGYTCDVSADGDEAVARYTEAMRAGAPYDAVILDLTIPGKRGGLRAFEKLRDLDPEIVALVASGYAADNVLATYEQHGFRGRIRKPIDLRSLSAALAQALAR